MALPPPSESATALVTGASAGIGEAIARQLASRGHGVTLVARREERLRALAGELSEGHGVRAEAIAADLGDAAARDQLAAQIEGLGLEVEILVSNAGFGDPDNGGRLGPGAAPRHASSSTARRCSTSRRATCRRWSRAVGAR